MWDPLGILLPNSMKYKIAFQQLWKLGYGWDEPISDTLQNLWEKHFYELSCLENIVLDRCIKPVNLITTT